MRNCEQPPDCRCSLGESRGVARIGRVQVVQVGRPTFTAGLMRLTKLLSIDPEASESTLAILDDKARSSVLCTAASQNCNDGATRLGQG
jgi:hypothetical protein